MDLTSASQVCGFIATMRSTPPRAPRWPASEIRTSYQVGRPWMLEGKMLRDVADVDAGVALDAELRGEDGLHVAVEAALGFLERLLEVEAELDLGGDIGQRGRLLAVRDLVAQVDGDGVVVAPLVDAHLLRGE